MKSPVQSRYSQEVLEYKKKYYQGLPEKARRHFLGQEYLHLGPGSQRYLAGVFECSRDTIQKGSREVSAEDFEADYSRQRAEGGGRKKKSSRLKA
jgi:hypothetical protein